MGRGQGDGRGACGQGGVARVSRCGASRSLAKAMRVVRAWEVSAAGSDAQVLARAPGVVWPARTTCEARAGGKGEVRRSGWFGQQAEARLAGSVVSRARCGAGASVASAGASAAWPRIVFAHAIFLCRLSIQWTARARSIHHAMLAGPSRSRTL